MIELLVIIRTLAIVAAIVSFAIAWIVPGIGSRPFALARRIAAATGIGAQWAIAGTNVARGREPWTKLLVPLVATAVSVELFRTGSLPIATLGVAAALELGFAASLVYAGLRAPATPDAPYFEQRLARGFERIVDSRLARFFALETTVMLSALRFLAGGFRRSPKTGFGVTRTASALPLLLALPVFLVPSTVAVDLLIPAAHPLWRLADDALNGYAMLWGVGVYATFRDRPHRVARGALLASFGAFRTVRVPLADIASVCIQPPTFDTRAWKKAHRRDGLSFALDGAPAVELTLARPLDLPARGSEGVWRLALSADDARGLARALMHPT